MENETTIEQNVEPKVCLTLTTFKDGKIVNEQKIDCYMRQTYSMLKGLKTKYPDKVFLLR